jgi:hypothetical protein
MCIGQDMLLQVGITMLEHVTLHAPAQEGIVDR